MRVVNDEDIMLLVNEEELWKLVNKVLSAKVTGIVRDWVYYNLNDEIQEKLGQCEQPLKVKIYKRLDKIAAELSHIIYNDIDKLISEDNVQDKLAKELLDELHN